MKQIYNRFIPDVRSMIQFRKVCQIDIQLSYLKMSSVVHCAVFEIMTALPPKADKNLYGQTEVGPSPPCQTGNFQAIKLLGGQHRHVIYRWTDNKGLYSDIFDFFYSFYKKKCRLTTFCQGGQHLKVACPADGVFLTSVEHWYAVGIMTD